MQNFCTLVSGAISTDTRVLFVLIGKENEKKIRKKRELWFSIYT